LARQAADRLCASQPSFLTAGSPAGAHSARERVRERQRAHERGTRMIRAVRIGVEHRECGSEGVRVERPGGVMLTGLASCDARNASSAERIACMVPLSSLTPRPSTGSWPSGRSFPAEMGSSCYRSSLSCQAIGLGDCTELHRKAPRAGTGLIPHASRPSRSIL